MGALTPVAQLRYDILMYFVYIFNILIYIQYRKIYFSRADERYDTAIFWPHCFVDASFPVTFLCRISLWFSLSVTGALGKPLP